MQKGMNSNLWHRIVMNKWVYILFIPAFVYFAIFSYSTFYGISIAFKDYKPFVGINGSEWVGWKHFKSVFQDINFYRLMRNTLKISVARIIFEFPIPIIFALLLNEVRNLRFKKVVQTITCFPNFLSWVVFAGIVYNFTGPNGVINMVLENMGMNTVNLTTNPSAFLPLLVVTSILKGFGWGSIIYMAAISGVDIQLYEAASLDGAGKLRQIWHVTLAGIRPIICFQLIMSVAGILNAGFDQVFMFLKPALYETGDIIDTYVYRIGLVSAKYEYATALGLFKSVISVILIVSANTITRKLGEKSLW